MRNQQDKILIHKSWTIIHDIQSHSTYVILTIVRFWHKNNIYLSRNVRKLTLDQTSHTMYETNNNCNRGTPWNGQKKNYRRLLVTAHPPYLTNRTWYAIIRNEGWINSKQEINEPCREKRQQTNLSVRMPGNLERQHMPSSLTEVFNGPTTCVSEQHRFWRDCADAQARLNLCCSHKL